MNTDQTHALVRLIGHYGGLSNEAARRARLSEIESTLDQTFLAVNVIWRWHVASRVEMSRREACHEPHPPDLAELAFLAIFADPDDSGRKFSNTFARPPSCFDNRAKDRPRAVLHA